MSAPKGFPDWLRERVRAEVREATKPKPTKPPTKAKPAPVAPRKPGKPTITALPDTAGPTELANRAVAGPWRVPRPSTDAHDVEGPSPCRCCGGPVAVEGATYAGPWRQHPACEPLLGWQPARVQAAARALAVGDLEAADAALVGVTVHRYADVHPEPTWSAERLRDRLPWRHVDRAALRAAVDVLPALRVEAGMVATECTAGPCAWCGVVESAGWVTHGHTWPDGSAAPLCAGCSAVYLRNGEPDAAWWDGQRPAMGEAVTGVPTMMGERPPERLRGFAESVGIPTLSEPEPTAPIGAVTATGTFVPVAGEPWSHLNPEAVKDYRFTVWARFGLAYCPPEHRGEVERWAGERDAARMARRAEQEAEQAAKANVHGF